MKFDIFGSCVSRDPFELDNNNHSVGVYSSRSSLVSSMDEKQFEDKIDFDLGSNFKNRIVYDDLFKNFKEYSKSPNSNAIIVDLIQERYGVNEYKEGFYTLSNEHRLAKLPIGNIVRFEEHYNLFDYYISKIAEIFSNYEFVIVHEVNLCPLYYKQNNELGKLPINEQDEYFIKEGSRYYNIFKDHVPNTYTLKLDGYLGTENHRWGPGKAHYENDYQIKFNEGLDYIIENKDDFIYLKNYGLIDGIK